MHHAIAERLRAQNNGQAWRDCNDRGRPHHWVFETHGEAGTWFTCKRCPISTVTSKLDSDGRRVHPAPFLRSASRLRAFEVTHQHTDLCWMGGCAE